MTANYEYETSPRKIKTSPQKNKVQNSKKNQQKYNEQKKNYSKNVALIAGMFFILLVVSYRNSLINEKFKELQKQKAELSTIQKVNEQLKVSIEGNLNLENVERQAKEQLNLQKLDNNQKVYITLPKKDYTEIANDEIKLPQEKVGFFKKIINKILGE